MRPWHLFLAAAVRRPKAFVQGVREFRSSFTTSQQSELEYTAYDTGRELAHIATRRRYDD
jgi:hypothetical protein